MSRKGMQDTVTGTVSSMEGNKCYTVQDLQDILRVSRIAVSKILKKKEFRWIRLDGGQYRISRKSFDEWLDGEIKEDMAKENDDVASKQ